MIDDKTNFVKHWHKIDFHVHTPASSDYQQPDITPSQWLQAVMEQKIDCVVITDHNSGEWIDKIKTVILQRPDVFPEQGEHQGFLRLEDAES